jgi:hypothetical protein
LKITPLEAGRWIVRHSAHAKETESQAQSIEAEAERGFQSGGFSCDAGID